MASTFFLDLTANDSELSKKQAYTNVRQRALDTSIKFIGVSDKWMFGNCCTYERVSTPPVPAFIFDFY